MSSTTSTSNPSTIDSALSSILNCLYWRNQDIMAMPIAFTRTIVHLVDCALGTDTGKQLHRQCPGTGRHEKKMKSRQWLEKRARLGSSWRGKWRWWWRRGRMTSALSGRRGTRVMIIERKNILTVTGRARFSSREIESWWANFSVIKQITQERILYK